MNFWVILVPLMIAVGCSNPRSANKSNFGAAIDAYLERHGEACVTAPVEFPYEFETGRARLGGLTVSQRKMLAEFVRIGFLSGEEVELEKEYTSFGSTLAAAGLPPQKRTKVVKATRIKLTAEGETFAEESLSNPLKPATKFCYGNYRLHEITGYTEPADMLGKTVSNVKFTYKAEDIKEWVRRSPALEGFGRVRRDLRSDTEPIEGSATLVLTDRGWIHGATF